MDLCGQPTCGQLEGIGVDLCGQPTCGQLESYGDVADLCGQLHQCTLESVVFLEISGVGDLCGHLHQHTLESAVFLEISRDNTSDSECLDAGECPNVYVPRSPGVQRYERNELFAHIGSVSSFSNQGTVPTSKIILGMGLQPTCGQLEGIGVDLCGQPTCGQLESYGDVADLCGQLHQRTLESVIFLEISGVGDLCRHLHQRTLESAVLCFSCIPLCESTLKLIGDNTYPSRALRHLGGSLCSESICWKPMEEIENIDWWCRIFISFCIFGFSCGYYLTIYHLLHFMLMVWSSLHSILVSVYTVTDDPHLCLVVRARLAYGIMRIKRMPYCELVRLCNSHVPLLDLEDKRGVLRSNMLCRRMRGASLSDLSRIYDASDIISRNVEQILSQNPKFVKQQRRWANIVCDLNGECVDERTVEMILFIILLLSLFESADNDLRDVILYGVPGLPSVSVSETATYAEIRSMIVQMAPRMGDFYFVARGRIIKIEDTLIDWGSGHLVLNIHTCGNLLGGSMQGSSDDERRVRNRKKRFDLKRLLL